MVRYALGTLILVSACAAPAKRPADAPNAAALKSGVSPENFDKSVRAQDDFYHHVSGAWLERTEIPADKSNYGSFTKLFDDAEAHLKAIIDEIAADPGEAGSERRKIADLFNSFVDTKQVDSAGAAPLAVVLKRIATLDSRRAVAVELGRLQRNGIRSPLYMYIDQDAKESTRYISYLHQSGLGLPDRDYYFDEGERFDGYRSAYRVYVGKLLTLAGLPSDEASVTSIVDLERDMATKHWTRVANRDRDKTYNKKTFAELAALAPAVDWAAYFEGAAMPPAPVIVRQPDYLQALSDLMKTVDVARWRLYLSWCAADALAPYLDDRFVDAHFAFHKKTLSGIEAQRPRWKRAVELVDHGLGMALGKIYVERHFRPEAKARMKTLVANLTAAFDEGIDGLEWMTAVTKVQAKQKLSKFVTKIGYPDAWLDYGNLDIRAGDLVGNVTRSRHFEHDRWVAKLGGPIDRGEWFMTPQTVNAYYNPPMNEIVFPAAILQPPFFNLEADDAVNYGAIGAVIGHELSHGFDDQGRKSDGDGNLRDWWTKTDAEQFEARAKILSDQYDGYRPRPDAHVNGKLTLGENIGDLGGLTIAYAAYRRSLGGKEAPVIDGFTGDQRFFLGWAQIWRRKYREAELSRRLVTDPHSPSQYRVLGVLSNMPQFYKAWGVKEGDAMFRAEEIRVKIW